MKYLFLIIGLITMPVAANSGSWSGNSIGGQVSVGQQTLVSHPIAPSGPLPETANITSVTWHITLLNPPPPGLQIKLCARSICIPLQSLSGTQQISTQLSANQSFRFIYSVQSRGPLMPALQVVSNQLTLNYH